MMETRQKLIKPHKKRKWEEPNNNPSNVFVDNGDSTVVDMDTTEDVGLPLPKKNKITNTFANLFTPTKNLSMLLINALEKFFARMGDKLKDHHRSMMLYEIGNFYFQQGAANFHPETYLLSQQYLYRNAAAFSSRNKPNNEALKRHGKYSVDTYKEAHKEQGSEKYFWTVFNYYLKEFFPRLHSEQNKVAELLQHLLNSPIVDHILGKHIPKEEHRKFRSSFTIPILLLKDEEKKSSIKMGLSS